MSDRNRTQGFKDSISQGWDVGAIKAKTVWGTILDGLSDPLSVKGWVTGIVMLGGVYLVWALLLSLWSVGSGAVIGFLAGARNPNPLPGNVNGPIRTGHLIGASLNAAGTTSLNNLDASLRTQNAGYTNAASPMVPVTGALSGDVEVPMANWVNNIQKDPGQ